MLRYLRPPAFVPPATPGSSSRMILLFCRCESAPVYRRLALNGLAAEISEIN
jgi:hypothetical protein